MYQKHHQHGQRMNAICCCSPAAVVIKMALDQVLLSPIGICLFYSIIKTMEGTGVAVF